MSGATVAPSSLSRAEKWKRSNRSSKASRQSALDHRAGPWRRSRPVGSNRPPFRNGRLPRAHAAPERSPTGRLRAPKHSGSNTWRGWRAARRVRAPPGARWRTRDAADPRPARMPAPARRVRPAAGPPRGLPAPGRAPRVRTRGTRHAAPPAPRARAPPLRLPPDRARARAVPAPTPLGIRAPQKGGEDRRSARCGREGLAARDPWFGDDQGGAARPGIMYRGIAGRAELLRSRDALLQTRIPYPRTASRS